MSPAVSPAHGARLFEHAVIGTFEAVLPGAVHRHGSGAAEMAAAVAACRAAAAALGRADGPLGEAIASALGAWRGVGHEANHGTILLCAPLLRAAALPGEAGLPGKLSQTLSETTAADAAQVFEALGPGGLAGLRAQDAQPGATLREAITAAAGRDRLARTYAQDFRSIFEDGLPLVERAADPLNPAASADLYLLFLAAEPDTQLIRRFGSATAEMVRQAGQAIGAALAAGANPAERHATLLALDTHLRMRGIAPETSADLLAATRLAWLLQHAQAEPPPA